MSNNTIIQVHTTIKDDMEQEEQFTTTVRGQVVERNGFCFLRYQEEESSEMGNTWTIIKWAVTKEPVSISIIRQGDVKMKQVFQQGKPDISTYQSNYGSIEMEIITHDISVKKKQKQGELHIQYELKMNKTIVGKYDVRIYYQKIEGVEND